MGGNNTISTNECIDKRIYRIINNTHSSLTISDDIAIPDSECVIIYFGGIEMDDLTYLYRRVTVEFTNGKTVDGVISYNEWAGDYSIIKIWIKEYVGSNCE